MRIAGIDIGGTSIKAGIFEDGVLIHKTSRKTPFGNPQSVCEAIRQMLSGWNVDQVGVGSAGSISAGRDSIFASNLGWEGVPLKKMLEETLSCPVWLDNDAQAALMAEWHDGVCRHADCALYLTLGTGIGGAMIVDGKPYRGKNNLGAEFGHMIIHPDGPRCSCGRRGCLEYYASASGLRRLAGGRPAREIIDSVLSEDPQTLKAFADYVHELCIGLNNLIMIFDPQVIVLGGGISGAGDFLADACQRELFQLFGDTTDPLLCQVRIARHQNDAGIIGAMLLAQENLASSVNDKKHGA